VTCVKLRPRNPRTQREPAIVTRPSSPQVIRFGVFEVDLTAGEVRKAGMRQKLAGQPFQVLQALLERPQEVITREDLRQRLWPDSAFVDHELALKKAVNRLREVLGDSADSPHFIETIPRRGYRFIGSIASASALPESSGPHAPAADVSGAPISAGLNRGRFLLKLIAGSTLLAIAGILIWSNAAKLRARIFATSRSSTIHSIAVLPLQNLSSDPDQEYFSDGMTDELITDLAKVGQLQVISHTSVERYKGTKRPLPEIARELGVDAIVEGKVLRSGDRVRITAQLIDARTDAHLWAESYERSLKDVLALQAEVAQRIAAEIGIKLPADEHARLVAARPFNPEAYQAYLKGRSYWHDRTEEGLRKGLESFGQAIEKDPEYAPAYAGLADTYLVLGHYGYLPSKEASPKAKTAAVRALQIDGELAEAHASLAMVMFSFDLDWAGAEKEFKRAIELKPGYATAHHWYSHYLVAVGRQNDALAEIRQARELDPFSLPINTFQGLILYFGRQYDQAIDQCRNTLARHPEWAEELHGQLGNVYAAKGMDREAVQEWQRALTLSGQTELATVLEHAYLRSGYQGYLKRQLEYSKSSSTIAFGAALGLAQLSARLGDTNQTMVWLERAYQERIPWLLNLNVEPAFDSVRSDPRFQDLLRRLNLAS
jgi:TolB-like protein/DNA-binding winged helix-turn-helix (wHTH) protein/Tfp pilus assembly protein PilF